MGIRSYIKSFLYGVYDIRLIRRLQPGPFPKHLGVVLDGNRRFAKAMGLSTSEGHRAGAKKVRELLRWCGEFKIPVVTLWAFSTQNASRDPAEVDALMHLFAEQAQSMLHDEEFKSKDIRVKIIGRRDMLPDFLQKSLSQLETSTAHRQGMLVQLALAYGGREEIVDAAKGYLLDAEAQGLTLRQAAEQMTEALFSKHMYGNDVPDPDFIIRTSGEVRLSGFLLWQSAFSEYYFLDVNWPGFRRVDFLRALRSFQLRQRRFGK